LKINAHRKDTGNLIVLIEISSSWKNSGLALISYIFYVEMLPRGLKIGYFKLSVYCKYSKIMFTKAIVFVNFLYPDRLKLQKGKVGGTNLTSGN